MSDEWVSIWDIALLQAPENTRFYASRLLNYCIFYDVPKRLVNISSALSHDLEKVYSISINSPNVDLISKNVYLNQSSIKSHIENHRFNFKERYLPRRPRHEKYLFQSENITKKETDEIDNRSDHLNYFESRGIPFILSKKNNTPIAMNYRDNLIIDEDLASIREFAKKKFFTSDQISDTQTDIIKEKYTISKVGALNSDDALLWNVFRTLFREKGFHYIFSAKPTLGNLDKNLARERISGVWFWGMNDKGGKFKPFEQTIKNFSLEVENSTYLEPSILFLGINRFFLIEGKYSTTFSSCPALKQGSCKGIELCPFWKSENAIPAILPNFVNQDIAKTCGRHFTLMKTYVFSVILSKLGLGKPIIIVLTDESSESGQLNNKLFKDFFKYLSDDAKSSFLLLSWQALKLSIPNEAKFLPLHCEFIEKWNIDLLEEPV